MRDHRTRRFATALAACALLAGLVAGCSATAGGGSDDAARPTTTDDAASTTTTTDRADDGGNADDPGDDADGDDPATAFTDCSAADAVAEVTGPVDHSTPNGGGFGGTDLSYSYSGCSYDLADGGEVDVTRITKVDPMQGTRFETIDAVAANDFDQDGIEHLRGLGDDAYRLGGDVAVLDGDHLLVASFSPSGEFGDDDVATAKTLAEAALDVDLGDPSCDALAPVVESVVGPAASSVSAFGGITTDDVEVELNGCSVTLDDGGEASLRVGDGSLWDAWIAAEDASTFTSHYQQVTVGELTGFDDGEQLVVDTGDEPLRIHTADLTVDAADAAALRLAVAELVLGA